MNAQMIAGFIALIKEIMRHPGVKKHNTRKNRVQNILMLCFLLMFFGFTIMTEQAILQSAAKYELQNTVRTQNKRIQDLELDLYVKKLAEESNEELTEPN